MITVKQYESIFTGGTHKNYYKDGKLWGMSYDNKLKLEPHWKDPTDYLTRAQGYKYWRKYFPGRICYTLPEPLQEAIDREPESRGVYEDDRVGLIYYEE